MKRVVAVFETKKNTRGTCLFNAGINALINHGFTIETVSNNQKIHDGDASFSASKLFGYVKAQIKLFARLFKIVKRADIVYINSTNAIAAALVARIRKAKLICHLDSDAKPVTAFDQLTKRLIGNLIDHAIFTSGSLKKIFSLNVKQQTVIYNTLPFNFDSNAIENEVCPKEQFCVIMPVYSYNIQSQKRIFSLASRVPEVKFKLLNMSYTELSPFLTTRKPANIDIIEESDKERTYRYASIFLDLSNPNENTFSGDIEMLEAMQYGLPVIVSSEGSLQELMINGEHGLAVPKDAISAIADVIERLSQDTLLYEKISNSCRAHAKRFSRDSFESEFIKPFVGQRLNPYNRLIQLFGNAYLDLNNSVFTKPLIN